MQRVDLPRIGTFAAWRDAARAHAAHGTPPEHLLWVREGDTSADLFSTPATPLEGGEITVPKRFVSLAKLAGHHADPERFALLYRLLTRLDAAPRLLDDRGDPLVDRLNRMAKEVGRDRHKMHAFLRFREVESTGRRHFAAWFEPSHPILEIATPFFADRFGDMDWSIFTPDMSAHFDGARVRVEAPVPRPDIGDDATEDLWRTYFRSIFNPARLKSKAMQAEMPKKYWANMPEAQEIPGLIARAETRAREMAEAAPSLPPLRASRIAVPPRPETADQFASALSTCTRCDLCRHATQAVPGEGPADARLMLVGEQPGDHEDLAGRPFVGPAGKLLDRHLVAAAIERDRVYLTNAVKHFKFRPQNKRRIHQTPNRTEVEHCRWWLDLERERVQPDLIVALGKTAALALTGNGDALLKRRGRFETTPDGTPVLITVHPSYLLRLPDPRLKAEEAGAFTGDLAKARHHLAA